MKPRNQENMVEKWMKNPLNKQIEDLVKEEKRKNAILVSIAMLYETKATEKKSSRNSRGKIIW